MTLQNILDTTVLMFVQVWGYGSKKCMYVFIDPAPVQLIIQFLEQASKPSVNEQNQVQPPVDNRRNRTLKLLALKVAAHMKWDLDALEKG